MITLSDIKAGNVYRLPSGSSVEVAYDPRSINGLEPWVAYFYLKSGRRKSCSGTDFVKMVNESLAKKRILPTPS
jgi:hypothetical protein